MTPLLLIHCKTKESGERVVYFIKLYVLYIFFINLRQAGTQKDMSNQGVRRNGPVKLRLTGKNLNLKCCNPSVAVPSVR